MQIGFYILGVVEILFGLFVFNAGRTLWGFKSVLAEMEKYEAGKNHDFFHDWFLGWRFKITRDFTRWLLRKAISEKAYMLFLKAAGLFFMIVSPLSFISALIHFGLLF